MVQFYFGVDNNELVEVYRKYFDVSYDAFKQELIALRSHIEQTLSEAAALKAKARFAGLASEVDYWRPFGPITFVKAPSLDQLQVSLAAVYVEARKLIDAKIAAPVEPVDTTELELANVEWQKVESELESCNAALTQANIEVQAIKSATAAVNKAVLDKELQELESVKKRNSPAAQAFANSYNNLVLEKAKRVAQKEAKKNELDTYDTTVLGKYHAAINVYLSQFGAGFSLLKSEKNYVGKVPQWMYTIEINKQAVDVTKKPGLGQASFQTSMSAGDRSTLALAFFLAQLELDQNLKNAVVVFDDPFTSLDEFRRSMTAKSIVRVGQEASQVIVLSHDKHFLNDVFLKIIGGQCATFQISTAKKNSSIGTWDLKREVMEGYLQDHMDMQDFHEGYSGDAKAMRTLMRPLLEKYIRYRFPNQIPDGKWLGDMLGIISADPAHPLQPLYSEIDDINQYTAPFHHDPNTAFDEDEVRTYVGRTLDVVGGC